MTKNKLPIFFLASCLLLVLNVFAQQNPDTLKTKDVIIVKEFDPTITEAYKISDFPKIYDTINPTIQNINYQTYKKEIPSNFQVSPIKAAVMKGEPLDRLYRAHVIGAYGLYNSTIGELYINNLRSRTVNYGLQLKHLGSQGRIKNAGYSGFSKNTAEVYGKQIFFNKILSGSLGYDFKNNHYYGYNPSIYSPKMLTDTLNKENIRQQFSTINGNVRFKSYFKDSSMVNYDLQVFAYQMQDKFGTKESNVKFQSAFDRFYNDEQVLLDIDVDHNNFTSTAGTNNNTIIKAQPSFISRGEKWRLQLGLNFNANADSITTFHFYPVAYFKYNVVRNIIIPYVGIEGGLKRNNFQTLTTENPWLVSTPTIANSNTVYNAYVGVRGEFSATTSFNLQANSKKIQGLPLYINNYFDIAPNKFLVAYDTAQVTQLTAEFSFQKTSSLHFLARADYFVYKLNQYTKPWHLPSYKLTLSGMYDLQDKIILKADIFALSNRQALTYNPAEGEAQGYGIYAKNLKGLIDINLMAEYRYNKKISGFIRLNNIASAKFQLYNGYQMQPFGAFLGFTYSFWGE